MKKHLLSLFILILGISGCAMFQSIIKSSFPYTATLTIPASSQAGTEYSSVSSATSFDQNFTKTGNNGDKISMVRVVSARLRSMQPTDYNIGNLASIKIYLSKQDSTDEMLVASRNDIGAEAGNDIVLDFDNSKFLDELVRQPEIKVRMVYKLRKAYTTDVNLEVIFDLAAYPSDKSSH